MPKNEHLILCGGASAPDKAGTRLLLNLHGPSPNVRLKISDINRQLVANIPNNLVDLLEVACYIYAADSAVSRGGLGDVQMGARWRRKFRFIIPVRLPELWSSAPVRAALQETLSFLSEDEYTIEFRQLETIPPVQIYFDLVDSHCSTGDVILFSGGLDSLAGTIERLSTTARKVTLVSHESSSKISSAQKRLVGQLQDQFGAERVTHIPVWATLDGDLVKEWTHRTRSFLFAALGTIVARLIHNDRLEIFENGVVSLNLPLVGQVVGARATRTTHPQVLTRLSRMITDVLGRPFELSNPFIWTTKTEIVERIAIHRCESLIQNTRSCTRVHHSTLQHPHCGGCSQCIDRRFAILAAGQEAADPADAYKVDLFAGERVAGPDREMALAYVRSATKVRQMTDIAFFSHFGETSRVIGCFSESSDQVASRIFGLYQRHTASVCNIFDAAAKSRVSELREGRLPTDCLISLVLGQRTGEAAYPVAPPDSVRTGNAGSHIVITIDPQRRSIAIDRWGELKGGNARMVIALGDTFRNAARDELRPQDYPFTQTAVLAGQLGWQEETLRRCVLRCRAELGKMAERAGDASPPDNAVIESLQRHGYRLNPDRVRILSSPKVAANKDGHASRSKGHASRPKGPKTGH
ncbi:MAG: 7-cyano-7-deazaguanine synthase [Acetobacteraceae bacterium]